MKEDDSVKMQDLDDYNERVERKAEEIYRIILNQGLFKHPVNSDSLDSLYHFNDFSNDCIDDVSNLAFDVIKGNHHSVVVTLENKLSKWCEALAKKVIDDEK